MIGNLVLALGIALASGSALYDPQPHRAIQLATEWYSDGEMVLYDYNPWNRVNNYFSIASNVITNNINLYYYASSNDFMLYYTIANGYQTVQNLDSDFEVDSWLINNTPLFALRVQRFNNAFYVYPYWKVHNFNNYGLNSTFAYYWQDDEDYQNNTYSMSFNGKEFDNLDSYDYYVFNDVITIQGGYNRANQQTYNYIDYANSYVYYGGNFYLYMNAQNVAYLPYLTVFIGANRWASDDYTQGYLDGYDEGSHDGYVEGKRMGASEGYQNGYADGLAMAGGRNSTWLGLMSSIADTPIRFLKQMFSFELFGMNVAVVILSCLTAIIIFGIVKKVWK